MRSSRDCGPVRSSVWTRPAGRIWRTRACRPGRCGASPPPESSTTGSATTSRLPPSGPCWGTTAAGWSADALGTHEAGARECRGIRLAGCWAHVLRRFRDAVADFPEPQLMLAWIGELYRIDGKATTDEQRRSKNWTPPPFLHILTAV